MNASVRLLAILLSAPAAGAATPALADSSIRCTGGIVAVGDTALDLLAKCGPPTLRDRHMAERWVVTAGSAGDESLVGVGQRETTVVEEWSYDFGPSAFTCLVRLENGRIVRLARGSYGHVQEAPPAPLVPPRARCEEDAVRSGDTKLDVLARCGEPALQYTWDGQEGRRVEVWTYDHGRDSFVRYVMIEDGRVVSVSTGSYGYAD